MPPSDRLTYHLIAYFHPISHTIIHNAQLLSFHNGHFNQQGFDSIAVEDNTIVAVGKYADLLPLARAETVLIDANGKTLIPGFNDTHIHIWKVGNLKSYMLDVRGAASLDDMLQMLAQYARQYPDAAWITARGFNEAAWKNGRLPTRHDIDRVISNRPVYVIRTCAHIAVCNSYALRQCGIHAKTPIATGGEMQLDSNGQPNGIFAETALGLIVKHLPAYTKPQLKTMVLAARQEMYSLGITAATDPAVDPVLLEAYHEMNGDKQLGFRLNAMPIVLPDGSSRPYPIPSIFSTAFMDVNTVKFFSDGGLSGKTAALKGQYKNSQGQGMLRLHKKQYTQLATEAMQQGFSIATHAIGDAAIELVVDVYKQLHASFPHTSNRIEHLGLPEKKHLQDMATHNIATSMQAIFLHELGKNFEQYLDEAYLNNCYPIQSVLAHGIVMALSSDAPVVKNFNPLQGIATAMNRLTNDGQPIAANEAIDAFAALKAYTYSAAKLCKRSDIGALQPGMLADFILLDSNPLAAENIAAVQVLQTYVDGKLVYKKGKAMPTAG